MPDNKDSNIVPTGPLGTAVRTSPDGKAPVVNAGDNQDPRDNTPVQSTSPLAAAPTSVDKDGVPKFGRNAGTKLRFERDYWPKEQPENEADALSHRENRVVAGEVAYLPSDEAMDCIERGVAKREKD